MRKSEMTATQLEQRQLIINKLTAVGWIPTVQEELFERDYWNQFETSFEFDSATRYLGCDIAMEEESVYLKLSNKQDQFAYLMIKYENKLQELLSKIVSLSTSEEPLQVKDEIFAITAVFPKTYICKDDEFYLIIDDNE